MRSTRSSPRRSTRRDPPDSRLAALDALRVLPADVREAVRKNLADDGDPA